MVKKNDYKVSIFYVKTMNSKQIYSGIYIFESPDIYPQKQNISGKFKMKY